VKQEWPWLLLLMYETGLMYATVDVADTHTHATVDVAAQSNINNPYQ
jgi:hypothetical protein